MNSMGGTYTITEDDKRKMIGENLLEAHGFEKAEIEAGIGEDEYTDRTLAEPYSLTDFEVAA
jgi:hypothetical protein